MSKPTYDAEKARKFCARVAGGHSLQAIVQEEAMPTIEMIADWWGRKDFRALFARARQLQAETLVEEIITVSKEIRDAKVTGAGDMALAKLRIETLKWLVDRWELEKPAQATASAVSNRRPIFKVVTGVPRRLPGPQDA